MASKLIGRTTCPECGFESAHVKKSDKCTYRYCPECNSQHYARTDRQRELLLAKTRLVDANPTTGSDGSGTGSAVTVPVPEALPLAATPTVATPPPATPAPAKRRGLF
jgi:hypothetical protein